MRGSAAAAGSSPDESRGAIWNGSELANDFEATIGTQEVHSPPGAAASFTSVEMVTFHCGTSC